jgi:hypothetical protein
VLLDELDRVIASVGHHGKSEETEGEGDRAEPEVIKKAKGEA